MGIEGEETDRNGPTMEIDIFRGGMEGRRGKKGNGRRGGTESARRAAERAIKHANIGEMKREGGTRGGPNVNGGSGE